MFDKELFEGQSLNIEDKHLLVFVEEMCDGQVVSLSDARWYDFIYE